MYIAVVKAHAREMCAKPADRPFDDCQFVLWFYQGLRYIGDLLILLTCGLVWYPKPLPVWKTSGR